MIVAHRKALSVEIEELLRHLDLDYISVDELLALKAVELYQSYGKGGGHPAQLNYGDCFAAAAAILHQMPLLYAGQGFQAAGF
jgi:ribonuclease VapC